MSVCTHKFAHIGLGRWGKNILRNLSTMGVPCVACDTDRSLLEARRKEFPNVNFAASFEQIIDDKEISAVLLSTPAVTHYRMAREALKAGKDVYVEKPLSLRVKEAVELVKVAHEHNRVLMVGHILNYHPAVVKLRELIAKGELGKIHYIASNRVNIGQLRSEENILWSFAPHDLSVIMMLIGEDPVKVNASGGDYLNRGIYDITLSTLEFRNGMRAHVFVSWLHPYKEQKLVVVGSKAMAVFDEHSDEKLFIYPHEVSWKDGKIPVAQKAECRPVPIESGEPLRRELEHFVACVRDRKRPLTDGVEGVRVTKVLQLLEEALRSGNGQQITRVIELDDYLLDTLGSGSVQNPVSTAAAASPVIER